MYLDYFIALKLDLVIILPFYNPTPNWQNQVDANIQKAIQLLGSNLIFVLVNDGSTQAISDDLMALKNSFPTHVIVSDYQPNKGKGYALRNGVEQIDANKYIYTDWDFPFGVESLVELNTKLDSFKEEAVAAFSKRTGIYFRKLPLFRRILSRLFKYLNGILLFGSGVDTQAGLKGFTSATKRYFLTTKNNGFLFEVEFARTLIKNSIPIEQIDVAPREDIQFTNFSIKTLRREMLAYLTILTRK